MQFFVYILKSEEDGRYYIGQTNNLIQRLGYHNAGRSKYTKSFAPWSLVFSKVCDSRAQAMTLEKRLKSLKSRDDLFQYAYNHDFVEH